MQGNVNIPDSTITTNLSFRQLVLMNMQQLTNFPYIEKDFDALTDYELLCLVVKFLNDVIANQNKQNDSITRMYESFLALQDYVNNTKDELEDAFNNLDDYVRNYFDNLDVQEEINNKLDQMLEDGVLEEIIESFLQTNALWCFDTVSNMKLATNFINGSSARTFGYYSVNDGGASLYKIRTKTNDDVIDEMFLIALNDNNLVAELIANNELNIKQIGAKGDGITDDTSFIKKALLKVQNIYFPSGTYNLTDIIDINNKNIRGDGYETTIIDEKSFTTQREHFIEFSGSNNIKNITLQKSFSATGDYKLAKVCGLKDCYDTVFTNVYFISDGYSTGGTLDVYTNNHDVIFNDCKSYLYSKDSSNNNEEGGIWIREFDSTKTTYNITLNNFKMYHQSKDEILGVWKWNGNLKDIYVNNCYFESPSSNTAPHFISIAGENINFNNCTMYNNTTQSTGQTNRIGSIIHIVAGHTSCYIENCKINLNSGLVNGIVANETTGLVYVDNTIIKNGNYNTPLGKAIYVSCNITSGILELTNSKSYNTEFNYLNTDGNYKIAQSSFELYNCNLNNLVCDGTILIQIFTTGGTIIIRNTSFNGTFNPLRFIHIGSSNSLAKLEIENSNIAPISGGEYITAGLINNCTSTTAITTVGSLTVNNVIVY